MAERAIHRKSQLIFNSVIPVTDTHEELVKKKLKAGKFPFTITSLIKVVAVLVLLAGIALFLAKPQCANAPGWYDYLYPIAIGAQLFFTLLLYVVFSSGCTVRNPGVWINIDIFTNLVLSILTIIASSMTMTGCSGQSSVHRVPGPLGIAGAVLLIVGCASLFLMYRYKEDEEEPQNTIHRKVDPRKSLHV